MNILEKFILKELDRNVTIKKSDSTKSTYFNSSSIGLIRISDHMSNKLNYDINIVQPINDKKNYLISLKGSPKLLSFNFSETKHFLLNYKLIKEINNGQKSFNKDLKENFWANIEGNKNNFARIAALIYKHEKWLDKISNKKYVLKNSINEYETVEETLKWIKVMSKDPKFRIGGINNLPIIIEHTKNLVKKSIK